MVKGGRPLKVDPRIDRAFIDIDHGNNDAVIKLLKELGTDAYDGYKRTALINAALHGNIEILEWCLENKADINFKDKNGMTALHFAAQEGRLDVASILLGKKADIDVQDSYGKSPLLTALLNWQGGKNEPMAKFLLDTGANPHLKNNYGVSPFDVMGNDLKKDVKK